MCCVGATLAARGEARVGPISGRSASSMSRGAELLPAGLTEPFIKVGRMQCIALWYDPKASLL
jgi:hypothetical protein